MQVVVQATRVSDDARSFANSAAAAARVEEVLTTKAKVALNALISTQLEGKLTLHTKLFRLC